MPVLFFYDKNDRFTFSQKELSFSFTVFIFYRIV